jgi:uncharacterized membrane protein YbaN (DUF454 family)
MARVILIGAGCLFVALGALGVALPLLPTTPFLLLAAGCFAHSSTRLHRWLLSNRVFGSYVTGYVKGTGIPLRVKVMALALLWGTICYAAFWVVETTALRIVLLVIAAAVTIHLALVKTARSHDGAARSCAETDRVPREVDQPSTDAQRDR